MRTPIMGRSLLPRPAVFASQRAARRPRAARPAVCRPLCEGRPSGRQPASVAHATVYDRRARDAQSSPRRFLPLNETDLRLIGLRDVGPHRRPVPAETYADARSVSRAVIK
jgi:hypothetical protein